MQTIGWVQFGFYMTVLLLVTKPMGVYLYQVLEGGDPRWFRPFRPLERAIYRFMGIDPLERQSWQTYLLSVLGFSVISLLLTYVILRLQDELPFNPQNLAAFSEHLAFNTAISFTTNTNWQSYAGESTASYLSQMVGLASHNFFSAAVGIAIAAALVRGLAAEAGQGIGNFWQDLVRLHLYLLLPLCIVFALFLVSQGVIQNFQAYTTLAPIDASTGLPQQTIAQGPVASQVAIKMLGTNGGGFFNANAAHPLENPTPLSNFLQMLSIFLIPSGLTYYLGLKLNNLRHGWAVWSAMAFLFTLMFLVAWWAEAAGNPRLLALGVDPGLGSMEGKETRFGLFSSTLFATITTAASCGAVNSMHDSLTPLAGLVTMLNIQLGEVIFGGVGAGLYGMMLYIVLAIFIAGLMIGRTPEYLGKKIDAYDIKAASLAILAMAVSILGFSAWGAVSEWGLVGLNNAGPHGFSEVLYAFSSATGNNGSAFAGLTANTSSYNTTLGIAMLVGRFFMIVPVLALAGHLSSKKKVPVNAGTFPVQGITFIVLLVGTVLIVGALTFLPALALGPVVEHFLMVGSDRTF